MAITDLDPSVPDGDQPAGNGDDELKAIKQALRDTFAGSSGDLWDTALNVGPRALEGITDKVDEADFTSLEARVSVNELAIVNQGNTFTSQNARITALETAGYVTAAQAKAAAWPVGSIFISADGGTPAAKGLPGTWSRVGDGRVLLGAATGFAATGGSMSVTLAKGNIPAHIHRHVVPQDESGQNQPAPSYSGYDNSPQNAVGSDGDSPRWKQITTENGEIDGLKSSPDAVNITPAHLTVAFYRRTA